jgi:hypothetical protein
MARPPCADLRCRPLGDLFLPHLAHTNCSLAVAASADAGKLSASWSTVEPSYTCSSGARRRGLSDRKPRL